MNAGSIDTPAPNQFGPPPANQPQANGSMPAPAPNTNSATASGGDSGGIDGAPSAGAPGAPGTPGSVGGTSGPTKPLLGNPVNVTQGSMGGSMSAYGTKVSNQIMTEQQRDQRYYEGGQPNAQTFYGNSTNVRSELVLQDMMKSVKDNWNSVDPKVKELFDSGKADNFFGPNPPADFKSMPGWKKAGLYLAGKAAFETANTFDPNHKDPGDQAWGALSHYNKDSSFKNYGLSMNLRSADGKAALTSPGYAAIADLNTLDDSYHLQQGGNNFGADQALDRAHMTFVDVNKGMGEYLKQKEIFYKNAFGGSSDLQSKIGSASLMDYINEHF
jgi:hypothetical protein